MANKKPIQYLTEWAFSTTYMCIRIFLYQSVKTKRAQQQQQQQQEVA